jgi:hypothetical protein
MSDDDFAFEPIPGVPKALPEGELILWQGSPSWSALAWRAVFVRPVLVYFAVLMAWRFGGVLSEGGGALAALSYALELAPIAAIAVGLFVLLAWAYARSTVYTITSRRLMIRSGVALPITVNVPFAAIRSAAVAKYGGGRGQILLELLPEHRVAALALWPHVRPWRYFPPQPLLLGLSNVDQVADTLGRALAASIAGTVPPVSPDSRQRDEAPASRPRLEPELAGIATARQTLQPIDLKGATS